jgi:hypothetical protein
VESGGVSSVDVWGGGEVRGPGGIGVVGVEAVGAQESEGEWCNGVTCEVVGEVVRRLGTSLIGGPR